MATRVSQDSESTGIIYEGANESQLCALFKIDNRSIKSRLLGLEPVGKRNGASIYDVAEVAQRMGKLTPKQIEQAMKRMNHADLPPLLAKEYWNGQRARQAFEENEGDLWRTEKVVSKMSDVVKALSMELNLLVDSIERQHEISEPVRELMINLVNGAKLNMVKSVIREFPNSEKKIEDKPKVEALPLPSDEEDDEF